MLVYVERCGMYSRNPCVGSVGRLGPEKINIKRGTSSFLPNERSSVVRGPVLVSNNWMMYSPFVRNGFLDSKKNIE